MSTYELRLESIACIPVETVLGTVSQSFYIFWRSRAAGSNVEEHGFIRAFRGYDKAGFSRRGRSSSYRGIFAEYAKTEGIVAG